MAQAVEQQRFLPSLCPIESAVSLLAESDGEDRGAVFTKREVVDFILDLVGYTAKKNLAKKRLLEPSVGHGEFLLAACDRLLRSWRRYSAGNALEELGQAITAVEIHRDSYEITREKVGALLREHDIPGKTAQALTQRWLRLGDFLLESLEGPFDAVVGNPPYVRQERIPPALIAEYRRRYDTIYDRADLYIPFFERSLGLLSEEGRLGFICSDRWMKNRYGGPLRKLIADQYHLACYIDMVDTAAFSSDVIAYPAITVLSRERRFETRVAKQPPIEAQALRRLSKEMDSVAPLSAKSSVRSFKIHSGDASPWLLSNCGQVGLLRRLESRYPTLEEAGCKVGIGVATGADKAFIAPYDSLDVEPSRKLPLATTRDVDSGVVDWRGLGIINPFEETGQLVDLDRYPKLARYLEQHSDLIKKRHVAKRSPAKWYRTIDRIYPELTSVPKLLIPDIKGEAHIVLEDGKLYPHHNLYYITSAEWPLPALQAVLSAGLAKLFVAHYSTQMRGGYLRFQAQYLRRIRIPSWDSVSMSRREALLKAVAEGDQATVAGSVCSLLGITSDERPEFLGETTEAPHGA